LDNNNLEVTKCSFALVPTDRVHPPLQINGTAIVPTLRPKTSIPEFNFRCADYNAMNIHFNNIDWDSVLCDDFDFSDVINNFYTVIQNAINIFTPVNSKIKTNYPRWYSRELKYLLVNKKRLHKEFKITKNHNTYNEFSRLRALCKKESKICYLCFIQKSRQI